MKEIYQVMSAAIGQEMRMGQIANNLANVNTVGFKKDSSVFLDELQARMVEGQASGQDQSAIPTGTVWPSLPRTYTDLSAGSFQETGRDLDVAIESEGFMQVQGRDGQTCYTRAGNLSIDEDGQLVNANGLPMLDAQGKTIKLDTMTGTKLTVGSDGRISANGVDIGTLGIVSFEDPSALVKRGEGLFVAPEGVEAKQMDAPRVRQATLEGSNVNAIDEMVQMIQAQRMYDAQQRVVRTFDELAGKRIEAMQ
ncbi:MAG: flagellar basal-body rod protein FlgF [Candidatus Sumerlaeia bacterium]